MPVAWILTGGPCEGEYEVDTSAWPPPARIRAVHGGGLLGDSPPAVLDLPDDQPEPGEQVVEYELEAQGYVCARGRGKASLSGPVAHYMPVGFPDEWRMQAVRQVAER